MKRNERLAVQTLIRAYENLITMQQQALRLKYIGANWLSDANMSEARGIIEGAKEVLTNIVDDTSV